METVLGVCVCVRACVLGMEMIVNIDQPNYVKDAGETAGIRLVVHNGDRMPFPEDEGITVSPGHSTSLGLQKVRTHTPTSPGHFNQSINLFVNIASAQHSE